MQIWGRYQDREPEKIDTCTKSNMSYMLQEYAMAFGRGWKLWVGRKCDEPMNLNKSN